MAAQSSIKEDSESRWEVQAEAAVKLCTQTTQPSSTINELKRKRENEIEFQVSFFVYTIIVFVSNLYLLCVIMIYHWECDINNQCKKKKKKKK